MATSFELRSLACTWVQPELRWRNIAPLSKHNPTAIPMDMLHFLAAFAALNLARYIRNECIEVLCMSGESAQKFCLPLLLAAYEVEGVAADTFPEVLLFSGPTLGRFYEHDEDLSKDAPAYQAQKLFENVASRYACFVDDHVNDGTKAFYVCKILKPFINARFKFLAIIARNNFDASPCVYGSIPLISGFKAGGIYGVAWDFSGYCKGEGHIDGSIYQKEHAINIIKAMEAALTFHRMSNWERLWFWVNEYLQPSALGKAVRLFMRKTPL